MCCLPSRLAQVTPEEIDDLHPIVSDWELTEIDDINGSTGPSSSRSFAGALEFSQKVGEIAEDEGHHPRIITEWGRVNVAWWTHKIRGLHRNDFIMAAKTDSLYE